MESKLPARKVFRPKTLEDEWDDPAMIALLRQQQEDREEFRDSHDRETWLKAMAESKFGDAEISFAAKPRHSLRAKVVTLPW